MGAYPTIPPSAAVEREFEWRAGDGLSWDGMRPQGEG